MHDDPYRMETVEALVLADDGSVVSAAEFFRRITTRYDPAADTLQELVQREQNGTIADETLDSEVPVHACVACLALDETPDELYTPNWQ